MATTNRLRIIIDGGYLFNVFKPYRAIGLRYSMKRLARLLAQNYALAGVHEYWVLDLQRRRLVVHRQNGGEQYSTIQSLSENDMASVEGHAESIRVGDLLP